MATSEDGYDSNFGGTSYDSIHGFTLDYPCLSFDILRDDLGLERSEFPHTVFCIAGTQTMEASLNYIGIVKLSNISGKRRELVPAQNDAEGSDMDSDSSEPPILQLHKVFHDGAVNRIRAMSQNPHICASWADTGYVQVWDLSSQLNALAESTDTVRNDDIATSNQAPIVNFKHEAAGFALDWSPLVPGRLVSGDCNNFIHLWEPTDATWNIDSNPFVGHTASVEDLQWSPTTPSVFASCSVDGSVAIWDTRLGKSPAATIKAHETDVNVISWNRLGSGAILASGSDDGSFSIWDLRLLKDENSMMYRFEYHKKPITSIEWSPHEASVLAVSSSDDQLTIWDLRYERDEEEEAKFRTETEEVDAPLDLPPELIFDHEQVELKELHWHSQIPGMVISTGWEGFNVMIPTNTEYSSLNVAKLEDCDEKMCALEI